MFGESKIRITLLAAIFIISSLLLYSKAFAAS